MNRFTVTWVEVARDWLTEMWMAAEDRQSISKAANKIDALLAQDPLGVGEEKSEGLRSLYVPPLHVLYSVRELDRVVEVASVRRDPPNVDPGVNGRQPANN